MRAEEAEEANSRADGVREAARVLAQSCDVELIVQVLAILSFKEPIESPIEL
jgi:hypothetical protein